MAQNNLHIEAKKVLKQSFKNILSYCKVIEGLISFDEKTDEEIDKYISEAKKHKNTWLGYRELYGILYNQVSDYLSEHVKGKRWETSDDLKNIINAEGIENLSDKIIAYLESIPRKYFVYFELPSVKGIGVKEINLTDDISFIEKLNENDFSEIKIPASGVGRMGLFDLYGSIRKEQLYIRIQTDGYTDGTLDSSAIKKAYSRFKQVFLLAKLSKVLIETKETVTLGLGQVIGSYFNNPQVFVVDAMESNAEKNYSISLPKVVSDYVSKISINENILKPNEYELFVEKFEDKDALTPNDKAKILKNRFQHAVKLLQTSDEDENVKPIKTAIEWAFDSLTNDNETVAFIQACIGLEAILGDEEEEPQKSLQNKLADRCAYLLGKKFSERKKIKENLVKLYNTRSKLIHGRKAELDEEQRGFLKFSQSILSGIIWKEISYIENS
ncbi:MAG: hypothetical protein HY096_12760 [Nitrospinae bacterium]|nr:hypothetical protein [Nitrospinota bacterium]